MGPFPISLFVIVSLIQGSHEIDRTRKGKENLQRGKTFKGEKD